MRFRGTESLTWRPLAPPAGAIRYESKVAYARAEQGGSTQAHAHFVSDVLASGEQHDRVSNDPEFLSVLNQPFSVRLDLPTLRDLRRLRSDVPFDFPSPMTGSPLHGRLRHLGEAPIDGHAAVGVGFAADGAMSGALPDRPGLAIRGAIVLRGSAYYDAATALLLGSQTTVTIVGNVSNRAGSDAVRIVYMRAIRSGSLAAAPSSAVAPSEGPTDRP